MNDDDLQLNIYDFYRGSPIRLFDSLLEYVVIDDHLPSPSAVLCTYSD